MPDAHVGYGLPIGGVLGIIPGSMGAPGYIVRGKGAVESLSSAAHGAGRRMSRTKAKQLVTWDTAQQLLRERGVTLSAGVSTKCRWRTKTSTR